VDHWVILVTILLLVTFVLKSPAPTLAGSRENRRAFKELQQIFNTEYQRIICKHYIKLHDF